MSLDGACYRVAPGHRASSSVTGSGSCPQLSLGFREQKAPAFPGAFLRGTLVALAVLLPPTPLPGLFYHPGTC